MRPMPQNPPGERVTHDGQRRNKYGHLQLVLREIRHRVVSIAHRKVAYAEIAKEPGQRDGRGKSKKRRFENTGRENKYLERCRRRQKCGDQHTAKAVTFDPVADGMGTLARFAMKIGFSARPREKVEQDTPQYGPQRRRQRIERHANGMLHRKLNEKRTV